MAIIIFRPNFNTSQHRAVITTGLVVTESQKESEKGTDIKFLGFRPLETNVVVASLVPRPPPLRTHILYV